MKMFRPGRPSPALVVSVIALVIALGGTSYAAFTLPKNSVGTKQLRNGAVSTAKLKNQSVTANKLKLPVASALRATQANTAITAVTAQSATNAQNATNAAALLGVVIVRGPDADNPASSLNGSVVDCPAGMSVINGGLLDNGFEEESINETGIRSAAGGTDNEFFADVNNISGTDSNIPATDDTFHVWAECIHGSVTGTAAARAAKR